MNGENVYIFAPVRFKMPDNVIYKSFDKLKVKMSKDSMLLIENPYNYAFELSSEEITIELHMYRDKKVIKSFPNSALTTTYNQPIKILPLSETRTNLKVTLPVVDDADAFGYSAKLDPWPGAAVYYRYSLGK